MKRAIFAFLVCFQVLSLQAEERPVVLIHGFLSTYRNMMPIQQSLCCCGFETYLYDYPSRRRVVQCHADQLIPYLQKVASQHPGEPIDFVTHSIGALVLRKALNDPCIPEEAKMGRAVLIAPPNRGSALGRRFSNLYPIQFVMGRKSGWQLTHWTECDIINCLGSFPPTMQVMVVAGCRGSACLLKEPNDGFLTVEETSLNTPYKRYVFPLTHGNLLKCPSVFLVTRQFLLCGDSQLAQMLDPEDDEPCECESDSDQSSKNPDS